MKINYYLLLFLFCALSESQAQSKHSISLNTGYTFNNSIELNGDEVEKSKGYILDLGYAYRVFSFKKMYSEIGFSAKNIFSSGKMKGRSFRVTTLRIIIPVKFVFPIIENKLLFSSGFVFQNNLDINKTDLRLRDKYSWRVNFLLETRYVISNKWYLSTQVGLNMRNIPDPFFINDPKVSIMIGINRYINISKNKIRKQ